MIDELQKRLDSITEDRRADYIWPTKKAASVLNIHPNKFADWWARTEEKLICLATAMPGETSAQLAITLARALKQIERKES